MNRLFVGGPANGKHIDVQDNAIYHFLVRPDFNSPAVNIDGPLENRDPPIVCKDVLYNEVTLRGNSRTFYIMAEESLCIYDNIIETLIKGYQKKT